MNDIRFYGPHETIITQMYTVHFPGPSELWGVCWEITLPRPPLTPNQFCTEYKQNLQFRWILTLKIDFESQTLAHFDSLER